MLNWHVVLITGTRDESLFTYRGAVFLANYQRIQERLETHADAAWNRSAPLVLVTGGATGVDTVAPSTITTRYDQLIVMPAHWNKHPPGTKRREAGTARNNREVKLLESLRLAGASVFCEAFPGPGSVGTWDTVSRVKAAGIPVEVTQMEMVQ